MNQTQHRFKEGESGNPNGRPKGSISPLRKQLLELRKRAANDIEVAYDILWNDFTKGESNEKQLAKQIYFKELVSLPKEWLNELDTKDVPKEIKNSKDVYRCLTGLIQALVSDDFMCKQEALDLVKALKNVVIDESVAENKENILKYLTDDQIKNLMKNVEEGKERLGQ